MQVFRRRFRALPLRAAIASILALLLLCPSSARAAFSTPVSCDAVSQDIRVVLKDLAARAGVNIVIDDNVQRRVTIQLKDVPFDEAARAIVGCSGFEIFRDGEVLMVKLPSLRPSSSDATCVSVVIEAGSVPVERMCELIGALGPNLAATPFPELKAVVVSGPYAEATSAKNALSAWIGRASQEQSELVAEPVRIWHLDAQEIVSSFSGQFSGIRMTVIRSTNSVVVFGKQQEVSRAIKSIRAADLPPRVIGIQVEVVEILEDDLSRLGVGWKGPLGEPGLSISWRETDPTSIIKPGDAPVDQLNIRPWIRASLNLVTDINLLVERGKARVLARPSVTTLENKQARITAGDRYVLVLTQGQGSSVYQQIQYVETGVRLDITPRVDMDGKITAVIFPQVSGITGFTKEGYPRVSTREAQTTVRLRDGETAVIGGLIENRETERSYGLPILGDIPIIGKLFSTKKEAVQSTELVILVTLTALDYSDSAYGHIDEGPTTNWRDE